MGNVPVVDPVETHGPDGPNHRGARVIEPVELVGGSVVQQKPAMPDQAMSAGVASSRWTVASIRP